ncbi:hypothetical protein GCM10011583_04360 [Streptomyces camponoticapitis]|uniref:DUF4097 domain-containing protein n=1 Tax=Streptomyces camponoticapitis TaxID=1616125 RepID=A0ABQ2DZA8_9ACTN|nr:DUF4097 family beta strand repeat-containing protein [Streptomyces camponoticapitis]GGJ76092.1 hypothetical protein GCM10011583_04360 [Streptomyces camponoticapitis]
MAESTWQVSEPKKLTFDDPVTALSVRIANGTVNVVGIDETVLAEQGGARLEISEIQGPPLIVTRTGSTLTIAYEDLPWQNFLSWLDPKGHRRRAVVSLRVSATASVEVGVVGAGAVISGIRGRTDIRGVHGDTTLVRLAGRVRAETVTGNVEAQAVTGDLRFNSVSGDLTVVDCGGSSVRAETISGDMAIDLESAGKPTDIKVNTVSGEVAIRLPHPADATVEANTTSGSVSNAFDDLRVGGHWGSKKITGTLGSGTGQLRAATVSGSIALLRRPAKEPYDSGPPAPADPPPTDAAPVDAAPLDAVADDATPADKKEL